MDLKVRERKTTGDYHITNVTLPKAIVDLLNLKKGDILIISELNIENKSFKVSVK
jgi:hypothetical protein